MKIYFSILVSLLFICTSSMSQNQKINWGPEIEAPQFNVVIGEDESSIYMSNIRIKALSRTTKNTLFQIDKKTQKVVKEVEFGKPLKQGEFLIHNYWKDGRIEGLLLNNNNKKLEKIKMDITVGIQEAADVDRLEKRVFPIPDMDMGIAFPIPPDTDLIKCVESNDRSRVATEVKYSDKKSNKMVYTVYDTEKYYTPLYTFDFTLDKKNGEEHIVDVALGDEGRMAIIIKDYFTKDEHESKKKKPNYGFSLLIVDLNGDINEIDLGAAKKFWKGPSLALGSKGGVLVASMSQEKPKKGATGIILMKYDENGNQIFVKNHPLKSLEDGKKKLDDSYGIAEAIRCTDDAYILVSKNNEYIRKTDFSGKFPTSAGLKFETKDILIDGFDGDGNYLWSENIYRKTREADRNYFSATPVFHNEEGVTIYLNSDLKNIDSFDDPDQRERRLPSKKNVIMEVSISTDGTVGHKALSQPDKYAFGPKMIKKYGEQTFFIAGDKKFKKVKVGVLD